MTTTASTTPTVAPPTGVGTRLFNGKVEVTWIASTTAGATYTVMRADLPSPLASGIAGTSYADNSASPTSAYTYTVTASATVNVPTVVNSSAQSASYKPASTSTTTSATSTSASTAIVQAAAAVPLPVYPGQVYASDAWLATLPRDSDGYTIFDSLIPANACIVGTQPGDYATFSAAQQAAYNNGSYTILFRRGATYTAAQVNTNAQLSGTATRPFIIGVTGDLSLPRPILEAGFGLGGKAFKFTGLRYFIAFGLDFYDPTADPASASYAGKVSSIQAAFSVNDGSGQSNHWWFEDCRFRSIQSGLCLQAVSASAPISTVIIRRCAFAGCYGQKYCLYSSNVQDLCIDECWADSNGAYPAGQSNPYDETMCQTLYLQEWSGTTDAQTRVINPLLSRSVAAGLEQRSGGLLTGFASIGCPTGLYIGLHPSAISNGSVMGAGLNEAINAANPRGWGVQVDQVAAPTISNLLFLDKQDSVNTGAAISLTAQAAQPMTASLSDIIVNPTWTGTALTTNSDPITYSASNCVLPSITAPGVIPAPTYVDSTRTAAKYAASLGISGVTDVPSFLVAASQNRRGSYNASLTAQGINAYLFAGFTAK